MNGPCTERGTRGRTVRGCLALIVALAWGLGGAASGQTPEPAPAPEPVADEALSDGVPPPDAGAVEPGGRGSILTAVREGSRMAIRWVPADGVQPADPVAWVSTGAPGHWPARDWRRWTLKEEAGGVRVARVPVVSASEPVVYCVGERVGEVRRCSPLRVFRPEAAGFREPTAPFLGFLEGFEDGIEGWEGPAGAGREGALRASSQALAGRGALRMEVPAERGSVTVGTPRIRGWMFREHAVSAVRVAVRTESGNGRLRFALHSRTGTDGLAVHPVAFEPVVGPGWQRIEVPVEAFAGLRALEVDWFSVQFLAESGRALLLDDVELVLR